MWQPDQFLEQLYEETIANQPAKTINDDNGRRKYLRQRITETLGGFPERKADLKTSLLKKEEYDDFKLEWIEYTTIEGVRVPAYVLIPKNHKEERLPAVLASHGHGYGYKTALGMNPDGTMAEDPGIYNRFAVQLFAEECSSLSRKLWDSAIAG
jgi:hypothetical protein